MSTRLQGPPSRTFGQQIAGPLCRFWKAGGGPPKEAVLTAFQTVGVGWEDASKQTMVRQVMNSATDTQAVKLFELLVEELQAQRTFVSTDQEVVQNLGVLRVVLTKFGVELDTDGNLRWPSWAELSTASPQPVRAPEPVTTHIPAHHGPATQGTYPMTMSQTTNYHGPVIHISGGHSQLAWENNGSVDQIDTPATVTDGYANVARAVTEALEFLNTRDIDTDDREIADESSRVILAEVANDEPNRSVIKRELASLRGVLTPIRTKATVSRIGPGAQQLIEQLRLS
ncbi:hypothetical protein [Rhodococcus sp. IEGM 1379]|uniref:hypothetical protein n=1 Tax=Rhodococcus sp. IEGM 1379 TaxID=3047086 RepID=UPI0024B6BD8A|nr:hypothetical protein [Rhodococcus sp. IEGM 1379]MDI9915414.1 hypothetical protein [Rhodococcus sp. IEGM 1379]